MRLRVQILLLIIPLLVVPLLALGLAAYEQLTRSAKERSLDRMGELIDQVSRNVNTEIKFAVANVDTLARFDLLQRYILTADDRPQGPHQRSGRQRIRCLVFLPDQTFPRRYPHRYPLRSRK